MEWIQAHWAEIGVIVLALHTLLKAIARVTTTKKDDYFLEKVGAILKYFFAGKDPK